MNYNNPFSDRNFFQGHKTRTWETFVFGGTLFLLAALIFAYPTLITYFFAGIILLAGILTLTVAWKLWWFRENISRIEQCPVDNNRINGTRVTNFRWNT
jgi:hypothetical protein